MGTEPESPSLTGPVLAASGAALLLQTLTTFA